jgi:tetratricopeptide (TPR) repeat protein
MEELVQALFDEGVLVRNAVVKVGHSLSRLRIPSTAQAVLAARIDRLSPEEKELLQTLAVVGRQFPIGVIRGVVQLSEVELDRMLGDLQLAEFVNEQPAFPETEYILKHALTQEVAYNSILVERRKQIHEQAAQAIEALYANNLPDHYVDLARHYERSGNVAKAVTYLHLAGQQALSRSAYQEANTQLTPALELLRTQAENAERDRTEIALVLDLAMYTRMGHIRGTETLSMLERALYLSDKIGDSFNRLRILEFLTGYYGLLPDRLSRARALNKELLTIGEQQEDPKLVGFARAWFGWLSMHDGDFPAAVQELEQAYRISGIPSLPQRQRPMYWRVHSRAFGSFALWASGYPTRAIARATEAFAVADDLAAPAEARIIACWWSGNVNLLLRESNTARLFSEEEATLGARHGLPGLDYVSLKARVLVQLGQIDAALSQMLKYKTDFVERRDVFPSWLFVGLANAYHVSGRISDGIDAVDEGLALCRSSGVRMLESEIHRLKGELLLSAGNDEAAAQCFRDAIDVARRQSAKSWELRATASLARLLAKQDRRDEARTILAQIYGWFTEGFDTADLKEAKALLDELSK